MLSISIEKIANFYNHYFLQLDVMDGHFVPNLTFGHPVVKCLKTKLPNIVFLAHMMVSHPEKWVLPMAEAVVNRYIFYLEATNDIKTFDR